MRLFFAICFSLASSCLAGLLSSHISHPQCHLDFSLHRLTSTKMSIDDILSSPTIPRQCPSVRQHGATRLAFVTPWNTDGYAFTTLHSDKLTHVAPVWYQVEVSGRDFSLKGAHDIKEDWLASLKPSTKVVPRFEIRFADRKDIEAILFFPQGQAETIVKRIVDEVQARNYDGATLEVPYTAKMTVLIHALGKALHALEKTLVLVIPANHGGNMRPAFTASDLRDLAPSVDYFSLNAYDHPSVPGAESAPIAPLDWTREILTDLTATDPFESPFDDDEDEAGSVSHKILLGLHFYGMTRTSDGTINTIRREEYLSLLEFSRAGLPLEPVWLDTEAEQVWRSNLWEITFPTVLSLLHRVELAREFGVGISLWEAGQGLDTFWDVL